MISNYASEGDVVQSNISRIPEHLVTGTQIYAKCGNRDDQLLILVSVIMTHGNHTQNEKECGCLCG